MIIVAFVSWVLSFQNIENISQIFSFIAGGSSILGASSIIQNILNKRLKNKKIIEDEIIPTIAPLTTILEVSKNFTEKQIKSITEQIDGNLESNTEFNSMIILISSRFCNLVKVEEKYHKPYTLALSYKLVEIKKTRLGKSQQEIEHAITQYEKIRCGNDSWELKPDEIELYHKFTSINDLLLLKFEQVLSTSIDIDAKQSEEEKKTLYDQGKSWHTYIQKNEPKLNKLLSIIHAGVPLPDFLKILASLETDIVLISEHGISDPNERKAGSGKKYVDKILANRGLKLGKLNHAVSIAFLNDITDGKDPRFFDLKSWGKQVEYEANLLREEDSGNERKFSFVMLQTSIHELHAFGDELGNKSRIKIDSDTLSKLRSKDTTISTMVTMSKILRVNHKSSLYDFINKNLEYLDGIYNKEIASIIAETLAKKHGRVQWTISDFINCPVTKEDFSNIEISDEQIDKILSEAKEFVVALKNQ